MKLLIDEQTPVQYRDVLAFLLPGHEVAHVNDLRWKSKKDAALLADAARRGFEVFLTNDVRQLEDPAETDAIRRSGIHHVRYRIPRTRTVPLAHLGLALGAVAAAMPMVMAELASAKSQRLVLVKGCPQTPPIAMRLSTRTARHPVTGPESTATHIQWSAPRAGSWTFLAAAGALTTMLEMSGFVTVGRAPSPPLASFVESCWYVRSRIEYRREFIAPTGSTVAAIILGSPIRQTTLAGRGAAVVLQQGFLIGPHDAPIVNEPTAETHCVGVVLQPFGCRAVLGLDPGPVHGRIVELGAVWDDAPALRDQLLALVDRPEELLAAFEEHLARRSPRFDDATRRCQQATDALAADPVRPVAEIAARLGSHTVIWTASSAGSSGCRRGCSGGSCGCSASWSASRCSPRSPGRRWRPEVTTSSPSKTGRGQCATLARMVDPAESAAKQLRAIESTTGVTVEGWAERVTTAQLERHGQIVTWLKQHHALTHGNANALAHAVRSHLAGGPPPASTLLDAQYAGNKAALRPVYDELVTYAVGLGDDVAVVVQKTGVSLRRARQFALIEAPSAKRIRLGLNLRGTPPTGRLVAAGGMCTHAIDIPAAGRLDDEIHTWLAEAYERAAPTAR